MPEIIIGFNIFVSIFLFFECIKRAAAADGRKQIRLMLCASFCVISLKKRSDGISIVPPPMPIPLIIPENMATTK